MIPFSKQFFRNRTLALILAFVFSVVMYPSFFLFKSTPMMAWGSELIDPVVSIYTFIPGFNAFQYEVFNNGNILWTSLRGLGWPIGGGDIQVAPFFPLTWLWIWLPPIYFWNAFVLTRLILMATACFLIAVEIFEFKKLTALFFILNFVFCTYHLRWMNHPWLNGAVAGVWYLYFLYRLSISNQCQKPPSAILFGLILATYSMITCGFPEGSAAFGFMTWLVLTPILANKKQSGHISNLNFFKYCLLAHLVGVSLASPQIFQVLDSIRSADPEYRKNIGQAQLHEFGFLKEILTPIGFELPAQLFRHHFNLTPFFFFVIGLLQSLVSPRKFKTGGLGVILCTVFYVLKAVPVFPLFNSLLGRLPILETIGFDRYFFNLIILCFAYFSAIGFESFFEKRIRFSILSFLLICLSLGFAYFNAPTFSAWRCIGIFSLTLLCCLGHHYLSKWNVQNKIVAFIPFIVFSLGVHESRVVNRSNFVAIDSTTQPQFRPNVQARNLLRAIHKYEPNLSEVRLEDVGGRFVGFGLSTPDLMDQAIMPGRLGKLRTTLFHTDAPNGSSGLVSSKVDYAWSLISNQFFLRLSIDPKTPVDMGCLSCIKQELIENSNGSRDELYLNTSSLPRAYLANRCYSVKETNEALLRIKDPGQFKLGDVLLEDLGESEINTCTKITPGDQKAPVKISILKDKGNLLELEPIQGPQILVVNDSFFTGWKAYDETNGNGIDIKPANVNFRGLVLPENRTYKIHLRYRPDWYRLSVSLISISILACLFWGMRNRKIVP